jgi:hypothetical protein
MDNHHIPEHVRLQFRHEAEKMLKRAQVDSSGFKDKVDEILRQACADYVYHLTELGLDCKEAKRLVLKSFRLVSNIKRFSRPIDARLLFSDAGRHARYTAIVMGASFGFYMASVPGVAAFSHRLDAAFTHARYPFATLGWLMPTNQCRCAEASLSLLYGVLILWIVVSCRRMDKLAVCEPGVKFWNHILFAASTWFSMIIPLTPLRVAYCWRIEAHDGLAVSLMYVCYHISAVFLCVISGLCYFAEVGSFCCGKIDLLQHHEAVKHLRWLHELKSK